MKAIKWFVAVVAVVARRGAAPDGAGAETGRGEHGSVERGVVEETVTNTRAGTVKVRLRAKLSPQMGGLVAELPHREGATVAPGELLLRLDDRAQRADLELARETSWLPQARADEACLTAQLAEKELARVNALHEQGIASDQNLDVLSTERDRSRAACAAARAAVERARARVAAAQVQLDFTELRAPFAGTIADVTTEVGEWITPAPPGVPIPPVIDLLDAASIYVSAPIDEVDAERVRVGQPARITVDSRPDADFQARLARVAPYVLDDLEQNRTVEVEVEPSTTRTASGHSAGHLGRRGDHPRPARRGAPGSGRSGRRGWSGARAGGRSARGAHDRGRAAQLAGGRGPRAGWPRASWW